ncbi:GDP-mannose 4,6-dehydratase [Candidatus Dependentiae bacterium]|nr:GDP-mannose 4,6-dehydratase [Candidatus Dependentiae bacterium]MBU4387296.1 GDP-mannose 4,6-dehydratase [Candidatus Dependentiae bacterium]MCG2756593.1 GDP-mannose 4,6-dehydratase [Candidatus Dependentiae bacterium]
MKQKVALITGITGQDGAYLSKLLLEKNYKVFGIVRNQDSYFNLEYLKIKNKINFLEINLGNLNEVLASINNINPDEIYNFAAQSSVGLSIDQPYDTINFNIISTLNLLESIRLSKETIKLFQPSSSEMYGNPENLPINEKSKFSHKNNPYAISKSSAHEICVLYRDLYKLFICCGIMFNHESYLRGQNFFVKKVIREAIEIKKGKRDFLFVGNLETKRDFGFAPEYVKAMWLMLQQNIPDDYVIASGKSISLKDIVFYVFDYLKIDKSKIKIDKNLIRPVEVADCYGDSSKAKTVLGWQYNLSFYNVLDILIKEELENCNI